MKNTRKSPSSSPRRPTAVSLFSGCGGSDSGLKDAGFDVLMANDILPYAKEVYEANLPETDYRLGDISGITSFPSADLLAGCYPCQGFSQGGAREADRTINFLYKEFARALSLIKPKAFIVENVSGMRRADFRHLLDHQISIFSEIGYQVSWSLLHAEDYGVPQERRRIIIVGIKNGIDTVFQFPEKTHGPDRQHPFVTIQDAIADLPTWPEGEFCKDPFHWYYLSRNRRRNWNELSKTIVSHMRHMPLHPSSPVLTRINTDKWVFEDEGTPRRFSYKEAARLQGFPADFTLPDTDISSMRLKYKVIGNAVPPPLFAAVAKALPNIW